MDISFNCYGNQKQLECCKAWLDDNISDIVYGGSKGSGKSYLGVSLIFGDALLYPGTNYFIARKKLNDLRKHTTITIDEVFKVW
jgi:phage terminase large subunit